MNDCNKRTNTLLYKNISLTLYSWKGWCLVVCERWVGDGDRLLNIDPKFFFDHSSTSSSSCLGLLNRESLRAAGPSVCKLVLTLASYLQLTPTNSNRPGHLVILLSHVHLLPLFFRLFTQVHLFIDSSVEGQSITVVSEKVYTPPTFVTLFHDGNVLVKAHQCFSPKSPQFFGK